MEEKQAKAVLENLEETSRLRQCSKTLRRKQAKAVLEKWRKAG